MGRPYSSLAVSDGAFEELASLATSLGLEVRVGHRVGCPVEFRPGFFLDGEIDIEHRGEWCDVHARRAARLLTRLWRHHPGEPRAKALECWGGDEDVHYCRTCGVPLNTGGIIDPGGAVEDLAEEIREGEDRRLRGFIPELTAYADSMDDDNPAWPQLCALIERAAKDVSGG